MFTAWRTEGCEAYEDTLKMTSLVDFFLPYLPLEAPHLRQLLVRGLQRRGAALAADKRLTLAWDDRALEFLLSKVEFDGRYPLEGAKQVESVLTRYTARILRKAPAAQPSAAGKASAGMIEGQMLSLTVGRDGKDLVGHVS